MYQLPKNIISSLLDSTDSDVLTNGLRGVEREALRVNRITGAISQKPHPAQLGSALTHPFITTDYAESLLEFVTPALETNQEVIQFLLDVHKLTYDGLDNEALWPCSMPCGFSRHSEVPLAQYGSSNVGQMKTIYRRGLGLRYGRIMQTIAGVHFNYSLSNDIWRPLQQVLGNTDSLRDFKSAGYFALIRNFKRLSWLILYLFGSSPAVCKSFFQGAKTGLESLEGNTAIGRYATSLRMSDIGYNNHAQASLNVAVNSLDEYVAGLCRAISTPHPPYQAIGLYDGDKRLQLSENILQIANEYYSVVRPKRVAHSGEEPTTALRERGVEYVEIRSLDIDPFSNVGVNSAQLDFLEAMLLYCAFKTSPAISPTEQVEITQNDNLVATQGRKPDLMLIRRGSKISLQNWAQEVCEQIMEIAEQLDSIKHTECHQDAVKRQLESVRDTAKTPSAFVLEALHTSDMTYNEFGMTRARVLVEEFEKDIVIEQATIDKLNEVSQKSVEKQREVERNDTMSLEQYLADYFL